MKPLYQSKEQYQALLAEQVDELSALQRMHYASNRYAVRLIFQAMDPAGSMIRRSRVREQEGRAAEKRVGFSGLRMANATLSWLIRVPMAAES